MALILEIRDRRGMTSWHPLTQLPLTVGRGLANDIILDDPYVDAQHVRIAPDDSGALTVRDLGSVNGVLANGGRAETPLAVQAGVELKVGRTTLRFRDQGEAVPSALVESTYRVPRAARWAVTTRGTVLLLAGVGGLSALITWLGNTKRSSGSDVFSSVTAALLIVVTWAGIWAVAVRGPDRRFQFRGHLAVVCAATLVLILYSTLNEWLEFFFPDVRLVGVAFSLLVLLAIAVVIVGHLTVAGVLTRRRRWWTGLGVSAALLVLILLSSLVQDEKFSDVPKFAGELKPISPRLVPTQTVDEFVRTMAKARSEADKAIKR